MALSAIRTLRYGGDEFTSVHILSSYLR
jgi:hypothetical protein